MVSVDMWYCCQTYNSSTGRAVFTLSVWYSTYVPTQSWKSVQYPSRNICGHTLICSICSRPSVCDASGLKVGSLPPVGIHTLLTLHQVRGAKRPLTQDKIGIWGGTTMMCLVYRRARQTRTSRRLTRRQEHTPSAVQYLDKLHVFWALEGRSAITVLNSYRN